MSHPVRVDCVPRAGGWSCSVTVGLDAGATHHRVEVGTAELARLAPGAADPQELVSATFAFLLEREPREAILAAFTLEVVGHYFPEYPRTITARLRGPGA